MAEALLRSSEFGFEPVQMPAAEVFQPHVFEMISDTFFGIQVRRVARQAFQVDTPRGSFF
jgi:hypothetical protein